MTGLAERIVNGDLRALARAATLVENDAPDAGAVLEQLRPRAGRATVIGITGPPGAGKSTLVDRVTEALRAEGRTVGILTVDPTSPFSGGAILGDRIRMQRHHDDPGVYIRSMATRGSLGGLARATAGLVTLLDASGRDMVVVETVGVGQDEVEIARLADVTVVVLVPGLGDDVQTIKAGIMEIADVFVINKSDLPGVERTAHEIQGLLSLGVRPDGWTPPIVRTIATEGMGVGELLSAMRAFPGKKIVARQRAAAGFAVDHLGIAVRSLDEALMFWQELVGLRAAGRETVAVEKVTLAMLPAGDSRIELLEPSSPDSAIGRFIEKRGPGLHHIALRVPDFEAAVARLRAAGARLLNEPRPGAGGHLYVFVHPSSAGGVLLELIQGEGIIAEPQSTQRKP
jgi:LAO/AO transport system kinase